MDYSKAVKFWDSIFEQEQQKLDEKPSAAPISELKPPELQSAMEWLSEGSDCLLDYGCGNGMLSYHCASFGVAEVFGIDISEHAVCCANALFSHTNIAYDFKVGAIDILKQMRDESVDGIILSNILDNLYPQDAMQVIGEGARILKPHGKVFVKLNDFISDERIIEWNIKQIEGNFYDDGLFLWNNTDEQWRIIFSECFDVMAQEKIYYQAHHQYNRTFRLKKKQDGFSELEA